MLETPRDRPLPAGWAQRAGQSEMGVSREKQEAARVRRGQGTTEEGAEGGYTTWGSSRPPAQEPLVHGQTYHLITLQTRKTGAQTGDAAPKVTVVRGRAETYKTRPPHSGVVGFLWKENLGLFST